MVDKVKALELRLSGMQHKEIAEVLGCSVAWCKANLKGVKQPNEDKALIAEIRRLGRTSNGATWGEINNLLKDAYPGMPKKEFLQKTKDTRKAARDGCPDVILRPYWMLPTEAQNCTDTVMLMAQDIYEQIQHTATKYRKLYNLDVSYQTSVVRDLSMLSASKASGLMPQGLSVQGDRYAAMIEHLSERNKAPCNELTVRPDAVECGFSKGFDYPDEWKTITMDDLDIPY